ncbi:MAG: hypothetical protein ABEJ23_01005 [Haloarculaceae archaeon]
MIRAFLDTIRRLAGCPAVQLLVAAVVVVLVPTAAFLLGGWPAVGAVVLAAAVLAGAGYVRRTGRFDGIADRR